MAKNTYTKGNITKISIQYNLVSYYENIPNYDTITTLPKENAEYIKEALPNVTSCNNMMGSYDYDDGCKALTSIDTTGWDTSNVTDMSGMFFSCNALTTLDVSKFNTSKVTDMSYMFFMYNGAVPSGSSSLKTLDVSNWDTSKVTNMSCMFQGCDSLTNLDVSKWNTSKVTDMQYMFQNCDSLTNLDVSKWDTSKVTSMEGIFCNCAFTTLDISSWDTSNVTDMRNMFLCMWVSALTTITGVIDMKSCTSYDGMFDGCYNLNGVKIKNPPSGITATSGIGGLDAGKYEIVS